MNINSTTTQLVGYGRKGFGDNQAVVDGAISPRDAVAMLPTFALAPVHFDAPELLTMDGVSPAEHLVAPKHSVLYREDNREVLNVVGNDYVIHPYSTLVEGVDLPISKVTVGKGGANCIIEYGTADVIVSDDGVAFTVSMFAKSSVDGSIATTFGYSANMLTCLNQLQVGDKVIRGEVQAGNTVQRARHTRFSLPRVDAMRQAFSQIDLIAERQVAVINERTGTVMNPKQIAEFFDRLLPASVAKVGKGHGEVTKNAKTLAEKTRDESLACLNNGMWSDLRGTLEGLLQAVDTTARWEGIVRGQTREQKVTQGVLLGTFDKAWERNEALAREVLATV